MWRDNPYPEFITDVSADSGGLVIWQDMTKMGKVSSKEMSAMVDTIAALVRKKPASTIGFITSPVLISEKLANNTRDMMRRFEDKCDAKGLANHLVILRMEMPHSSKKVPIIFHSWLVLDESTASENIFSGCQLFLDRWEFSLFLYVSVWGPFGEATFPGSIV